MSAEQKLASIASELKQGVVPAAVSVNEFLSWFGSTRRGWRVVNCIRQDLARHNLITVPDFESTWYYGQISFRSLTAEGATATEDPTIRLSLLEAANRPPTAIAPDEPLQKAIAVMIAKDFSQLPIMTSPRELKGMLSWRSIGSRLALGRQCKLVRDCMDEPEVLSSDTPLFAAIEAIAKADCVLVRSPDKTICGIVTATDLNDQFLQLAEPFLLISEIEQGIRQLLRGKFSVQELAAAKAPGDDREVSGIADLTMGEYIRLVQDDGRWGKVSLAVDRKLFCEGLENVRKIRNDVMHFSPEGTEESEIEVLREFAAYLRRLRELGAM